MNASTNPTVLLVDDNPDIQTVVSMSLEHFGFSVVCVGSGSEALAAITSHQPSLVIIDYGLPDMDGISVGERIRQSSGDQVKLILFSGSIDDAIKTRAEAAGFVDYLLKPIRMNELKRRIDRLVSPSRESKTRT